MALIRLIPAVLGLAIMCGFGLATYGMWTGNRLLVVVGFWAGLSVFAGVFIAFLVSSVIQDWEEWWQERRH